MTPDPFAPTEVPEPVGRPIARITDAPQLLVLAALHAATALALLLFALLLAIEIVFILQIDIPSTEVTALLMGVYSLLLVLFAAFYGGTTWALFHPRRWTLVLAAVATALWVPTCCAPIGIWGLFVLLRPRVLARYGFQDPEVTPRVGAPPSG